MLDLPGVTLCAVDTRSPELALWSLRRSQRGVRFGRVLLLTDAPAAARLAPTLHPHEQAIGIPRLTSGSDYSMFVLRDLHRHIETPHALITQWDSFVIAPSAWTDAFLDWDYLGAPWPNHPADRCVGNGGFSLRSLRLMRTMAEGAYALRHPEDECICLDHADALARDHGIRIAPLDLAERFAFENRRDGPPSFGFHGSYNFAHVLSDAELADVLERLPAQALTGDDGWKLTRQLTKLKKWRLARQTLQRHIVGRKRWPRAAAHLAGLTLRDWMARLAR